ncbi:uncharacterized protein LOC121729019 [Aricia agestis]|uniref:uncharacterized protein LOC121729019 n=1 Tax=Aricia agestis TaxID=91739 RepID=UPI001C209628|nr:uncharacterized protein LOC121729019 [Aricia agestis]
MWQDITESTLRKYLNIMKIIVLMLYCVSVVCARDDFYVFSPDEFTPETLRENLEEIKKRLDCFIDYAPCTPLTTEYKKIGTEVVANACARCPPGLKDLIRAFLEVARVRYPAEYSALRVKYDPTGAHFDRYEDAVGCQKSHSVWRRP